MSFVYLSSTKKYVFIILCLAAFFMYVMFILDGAKVPKFFRMEKDALQGTDIGKIMRTKNLTYLRNDRHYTSLKSTFNCSSSYITLLALIKSHPKHAGRRNLVRTTWGRYDQAQNSYDFRRFFLVGTAGGKELQTVIAEEEEEFGDIVTGNFEDTFYNLSEKAEVGFEWSYKHCSFEYLLETDDDVFINIPLILEKIRDQVFPKTDAYVGNVKLNSQVVRNEKGMYEKYSVSFEEYAGSRYQPYCSGGAYIFSSDVIEKILPFVRQNPFSIDDVYIGMLVYNAGVKATSHEGFRLYDSDTTGECEYTPNLIAYHPAKRRDCMIELFCSMLAGLPDNLFVQRNYLSYFSKCP